MIGLALTLFDVFDVPVFWPILMLYFLALFFVTMKTRIKHMIKYKYLPFSTGKKVRGRQTGDKERWQRGCRRSFGGSDCPLACTGEGPSNGQCCICSCSVRLLLHYRLLA
jgi:hypothetical protein